MAQTKAHVRFLPFPEGKPWERKVEVWLPGTDPEKDPPWKTVPVGILVAPKILVIPPGNPGRMWSTDLIYDSPEKAPMEGICVVRIGGIGDLIMLASTLQALRRKLDRQRAGGHQRLILATAPHHIPIFAGVPWLDEVIDVRALENIHFERYIDLRGAAEPQELGLGFGKGDWDSYIHKNRSDVFDRLCHVAHEGRKKDFSIAIKPFCGGKYKFDVAIVVSDTSPTRQIPPQYIRDLAKMIVRDLGESVALIGKTNIHNRFLRRWRAKSVYNFLDKDDVKTFIERCTTMKLIITPDSAAVHIGGAFGIPTLALFGNIDPMTRVKYYRSVKALTPPKDVCGHYPCFEKPNVCRDQENWKEGTECMGHFTPELIVAKVKEMLR